MANIKATNKLSQSQLSEIRALEKQCNVFDNTNGELWLSNEFNRHENMPCYFLLYEEQTLQGVLTIFAPATSPAEVSALVLPECRRRGHFRAMLCAAKVQLQKFAIQKIHFVHETKSAAGRQMIDKWKIAPHHSEYLLVYDKEQEIAPDRKANLQLKKADQTDFDELHKLNFAIFGGSEEGITELLQKSMTGEKSMCFKATSGGEIIGVCNINHTDEGRYIYGFGISPAHQRRGFGRAMLGELIRLLTDSCSDEILLEVDSENNSAYLLYTTSGFSVRTQYDYYARSTDDA